MNIEELKTKIRLLENLENNLSSIAAKIDTSASYLDLPSKKISEYYNIDGDPIDNNKLATIKNDLTNKKEYINNVIIPSISNKVKDMNQEEAERIERENRERQQREAAEAARRESEQRNNQNIVNTPSVATKTNVVNTPSVVAKPNDVKLSAGAAKMSRYISLK